MVNTSSLSSAPALDALHTPEEPSRLRLAQRACTICGDCALQGSSRRRVGGFLALNYCTLAIISLVVLIEEGVHLRCLVLSQRSSAVRALWACLTAVSSVRRLDSRSIAILPSRLRNAAESLSNGFLASETVHLGCPLSLEILLDRSAGRWCTFEESRGTQAMCLFSVNDVFATLSAEYSCGDARLLLFAHGTKVREALCASTVDSIEINLGVQRAGTAH
jgi:hypothetical protein